MPETVRMLSLFSVVMPGVFGARRAEGLVTGSVLIQARFLSCGVALSRVANQARLLTALFAWRPLLQVGRFPGCAPADRWSRFPGWLVAVLPALQQRPRALLARFAFLVSFPPPDSVVGFPGVAVLPFAGALCLPRRFLALPGCGPVLGVFVDGLVLCAFLPGRCPLASFLQVGRSRVPAPAWRPGFLSRADLSVSRFVCVPSVVWLLSCGWCRRSPGALVGVLRAGVVSLSCSALRLLVLCRACVACL